MGSPLAAAFTTTRITIGAMALLASVSLTALAGNDDRAPEVPNEIAVDSSTNKVQLHGFGVGFQVCTWDGSTWTGPVPDATLFDSEGNVVADHFAGPRLNAEELARLDLRSTKFAAIAAPCTPERTK